MPLPRRKLQSGDSLLTFARFGRVRFFDWADGEKFVAARVTAQRWQAEDAADESERSWDVFRRDALEVKIATDSAVSVFPLLDGNAA